MISKRLIVEKSGLRLDKFLAREFPDLSRTRIKAYILSGNILVNNDIPKASYTVESGDTIQVEIETNNERENDIHGENIPINILYQDEDIAVIEKPAGLVVHPGTGVSTGTLVHALHYHFNNLSMMNGSARAGIVHRLDKDTSGVMVIALNDSAHRHISHQFESRTVQKEYIGVTWGVWEEKEGVIEKPIGRKRTDPTAYTTQENGRTAETGFKVEMESRYLSLIRFRPKTGRTHQIRVHASSVNHPILCDDKYGGGENRLKGFIPETGILLKKLIYLLRRHALHAHTLSFTHPTTHKVLHFTSPLPEDIQMVVDSITHDARI